MANERVCHNLLLSEDLGTWDAVFDVVSTLALETKALVSNQHVCLKMLEKYGRQKLNFRPAHVLGSEVLLPNLTLLRFRKTVAPTGDSLHLKIPSVWQCMAWWLKDVFFFSGSTTQGKNGKNMPSLYQRGEQ